MVMLSGSQAMAASARAPKGKYGVGFRIERISYQGRIYTVAVWYPAGKSAAAPRYNYYRGFTGAAVENAPADKSGAPYPLIIFSHGGTACGIKTVFYPENLASFGYVVAAPDHKDADNCSVVPGRKNPDRPKDPHSTVYGYDWSFRMGEISATIDYFLTANKQNGQWKNLIDPAKVGVTGHSIGGFASLMVGGVELNCEHPEDFGSIAAVAEKKGTPPSLCFQKAFQGKVLSWRDPRVKAVLSLCPAVWLISKNSSEAAIAAPVMIISGTRRDIPAESIMDTYTHLPLPRYLIMISGANHFAIEDLPPSPSLWFSPYRNWTHNREEQDIFMDYSANFFNAFLKSDPAALEFIRQSRSDRVSVQADTAENSK